jgi:hypothetical protein
MVGATTRIGLQMTVSGVKGFCDEWNIKLKVDETRREERGTGQG